MNWLETNIDSDELVDLSNNQLLEGLSTLKNRVEYFYRKELARLEKNKSRAIITDLKLFEQLQKEYYSTKSLSPQKWFTSWHVYTSIIDEARKRKLITIN